MTDFTESLAEFRVLTKDDKVMGAGLGTGRGRRPNAFNNLKEFEDNHGTQKELIKETYQQLGLEELYDSYNIN